jgi:hypothetical protein
MITIGYGGIIYLLKYHIKYFVTEIVPRTIAERILVIFIMLISCGVFAYAVGNIGQIFSDMIKKKEKFKERMSIMTTYLNKRGINSELL